MSDDKQKDFLSGIIDSQFLAELDLNGYPVLVYSQIKDDEGDRKQVILSFVEPKNIGIENGNIQHLTTRILAKAKQIERDLGLYSSILKIMTGNAMPIAETAHVALLDEAQVVLSHIVQDGDLDNLELEKCAEDLQGRILKVLQK